MRYQVFPGLGNGVGGLSTQQLSKQAWERTGTRVRKGAGKRTRLPMGCLAFVSLVILAVLTPALNAPLYAASGRLASDIQVGVTASAGISLNDFPVGRPSGELGIGTGENVLFGLLLGGQLFADLPIFAFDRLVVSPFVGYTFTHYFVGKDKAPISDEQGGFITLHSISYGADLKLRFALGTPGPSPTVGSFGSLGPVLGLRANTTFAGSYGTAQNQYSYSDSQKGTTLSLIVGAELKIQLSRLLSIPVLVKLGYNFGANPARVYEVYSEAGIAFNIPRRGAPAMQSNAVKRFLK